MIDKSLLLSLLLLFSEMSIVGVSAFAVRCVQRPTTTIVRCMSVSGMMYQSEETNAPNVRLFTKEGCTLCDKVKDVCMHDNSCLNSSLTHTHLVVVPTGIGGVETRFASFLGGCGYYGWR